MVVGCAEGGLLGEWEMLIHIGFMKTLRLGRERADIELPTNEGRKLLLEHKIKQNM